MALEQTKVELNSEELPICCPPIDVDAWGYHPRVYLAPNQDGKVCCPYCSTEYIVE
ncbi:MAG TPA: zinc-finger domain-containing protein [Candidatus Ignatzschineria merdigallinarum]|uniref:Zinc-finger domain-containing protein n=1 Tax=Candidatus Ignatzschineria merdigallinarum TaxID=2838621 RepID=A0A9D1Q3J9_9GAMM|nr:zinc-finger domain-containing protein [Candidatus Ignatzschineria merdigallinarum]